jgi:hypothetical protein
MRFSFGSELPPTDRNLPLLLHHIHEACVDDLLLHLGGDLEGSAHFLAALSEQVIPLDVDMIRADLVGLSSDVELELFDQAAWFCVPKALRVERRPVADAAMQVPDVHKVEVVDGPRPRHLRVVDLEFAVGGTQAG